MTRLLDVWRTLAREQRRAALASLGLFVTMLLPWYSKTDTVVVKGAVKSAQTSLDAFQAFSFVEAAVLLVSAGVLALLFGRGEQRRFTLPGGDGWVVTVAGGWAAVLIFYRLLDKPGLHGNEKISATVGVEWGIFIALMIALGLAYAGWRIRHGERPAPPARRREGHAPTPPRPRPVGAEDERRRADAPPAPADAPTTRADAPTARSRGPAPATAAARRPVEQETGETALIPVAAAPREGERSDPVPAPPPPTRASRAAPAGRPRFPPSPGEPEQLSFEDPPPGEK